MTNGFSGTYYMKAVGVTYGNRQEVIKKLKKGDELKFVPEPTNAYDRNAVMIMTESGEQIGYISKEHNKSTLDKMNQGVVYYPIVSEITGGDGYGYSYGVNIKVRYVFGGAQETNVVKTEQDNRICKENISEKTDNDDATPTTPTTEEETNGWCIGGFILGISSVFFYWFFPILLPMAAVIVSGIGLSEVAGTGENGKGMGIWGLVLGIIYTIQSIIKLSVMGSM